MTEAELKEIRERVEKATSANPRCYVERVGFDDGSFAYEINDGLHLVSFREDNHKQPMKAKFNAELYVNARTDIPKLLGEIEELNQFIDRQCRLIKKMESE